jgi:hypothetical protein
MKMALRSARIDPSEISYVNAHGTSTPQGDICETQAIKTVFGDHARRLAVSSTKGATGHMLGAAGAVEMAICAKAIETNVVPPTIMNILIRLRFDYIPTLRRITVNAASATVQFGGHNARLVEFWIAPAFSAGPRERCPGFHAQASMHQRRFLGACEKRDRRAAREIFTPVLRLLWPALHRCALGGLRRAEPQHFVDVIKMAVS